MMRPPVAILGVPFDNVTKAEAVSLIERMIASRQPNYLVTPNVDFLVQARRDVELRRILCEAHLVLCDGTPLVWASRLLGNPLPERVSGSDLVPLLIEAAASRRYRLFLLGASPQSAAQAVARLQAQHPGLIIAGHYSPAFNHLLEMDHDEIKRQIITAEPDILLVAFGCPKQEKWVAMHYRSLGIPVTVGVGATIDFLGGRVKRAPLWMQRSGTEWIFRLGQEPRRLFRRYLTDFWVFASSILPQWWELQLASPRPRSAAAIARHSTDANTRDSAAWKRVRLPDWFDFAAVRETAANLHKIIQCGRDCVLEMDSIRFIDSTGVGLLIHLRKRLSAVGCSLILFAPSEAVMRALSMMRLEGMFVVARTETALQRMLAADVDLVSPNDDDGPTQTLCWRGEITAANSEAVWERTRAYLCALDVSGRRVIDLSGVRFIDSTGLGLMIRAKKLCSSREQKVLFCGLQPAVQNVINLARLNSFLLEEQPGNSPVLSRL